MRFGNLPFNYLGVILFKGKPKVCHLKAIVDKILSHFNAWKGKLLSYAGHLFLLNSEINSCFVYYFMIDQWSLGI